MRWSREGFIPLVTEQAVAGIGETDRMFMFCLRRDTWQGDCQVTFSLGLFKKRLYVTWPTVNKEENDFNWKIREIRCKYCKTYICKCLV